MLNKNGSFQSDRPILPLFFRVYETDSLPDCNSITNTYSVKLLKKIANQDPNIRLLVADENMIARVELMRETFPHFSEVLDFILRSLKVSLYTNSPISHNPVVLQGSAGCGKTFFIKELANAIYQNIKHLTHIQSSEIMGDFSLLGLQNTYDQSSPGLVSKALLINGDREERLANSMFYIDELEKIASGEGDYSKNGISRALLTLLEEENAKYIDPFLEMRIDASKLCWWFSVNELTLPEAVLSRVTPFVIPEMSDEQITSVIDSIFSMIMKECEWTWPLSHTLSPECIKKLKDLNSARDIKRVLIESLKNAVVRVVEKRSDNNLLIEDFFLAPSAPIKQRIGFIQ